MAQPGIAAFGRAPAADLSVANRSVSDQPVVNRIGLADVGEALREGADDFRDAPTHLFLLCLIYPVAGLVLGRLASGENAAPLLYPLLSGFALVGPFAAIGLYEMSRQREQGRDVGWRTAFDVMSSPRLGPILMIGAVLAGLFVAWLVVAKVIFDALMPAAAGATLSDLLHAVLYTPAGHALLVVGTVAGFVFAVAAMSISVVSFPMLIDRDCGPTAGEQTAVALRTSLRAVRENPVAMAAWGLAVAVSLAVGSALAFVGLAVAIPVLGHATWHLYRRLVV